MIHFYVDIISKRNFFLNALELIIAPFEKSMVYCLEYNSEIMGPIQRRKVIAAKKYSGEESLIYSKCPLYSLILKIPQKDEKFVQISKGMMPCLSNSDLYYFLSPYWENQIFLDIQKKMHFTERVISKWHIRKVIKSLKKNSRVVYCSSKMLAKKFGLNESQVIYPFFQSEDYPSIEASCSKNSLTIVLDGATKNQETMLFDFLSSKLHNAEIFIFGTQSILREKFHSLGNHIRFEQQFCSATLQAAFIQSRLAFFFPHDDIFSRALGALASGSIVGHLRDSGPLEEVVPKGLREEFKDFDSALAAVSDLFHDEVSFPVSEMRRLALRYNEKNFKNHILKIINGCKQ